MGYTSEDYEMGSIIICILNNRATLTIGKEYTVTGVYGDEIYVINDDGYQYAYYKMRFVHKSEFRQHLINQILK